MVPTVRILILSEKTENPPDWMVPLKLRGYSVTHLEFSPGSEEVLRFVQGEPTDVILIEAGDSITGILRFIKRLRSFSSSTCVIVLGSGFQYEIVSELLQGGVFSVLKSPCALAHLDKTIRQGLKNRQRLIDILQLSDRLEAVCQELSEDRNQLRRWSEDLSRLHILHQSLTEHLSLDGVFDALVTNLGQVIAYDVLCLCVMTHGEEVHVGTDNPTRSVPRARLLELKEEMLNYSRLFAEDAEFPSGVLVQKRGSEIILPMTVAGEKIGLLRVIRETGRPFDAYQSRILSMVAAPLALVIRNAVIYRRMQTLATKDELTSVLNRRAFTNALDREFKRAHRHGAALSLVLIDIDHFKNVNDCYGHLAGDRILYEMAMVLKKTIREVDVLARYGGEEFVIILPETNLDEAAITAQRIKETVRTCDFSRDHLPFRVTVSIGVSHCPAPGIDSPETLFHQADQALYIAKQSGRDRIVTHSPIWNAESRQFFP